MRLSHPDPIFGLSSLDSCRPFVFIFLRIAFPATHFFSQPSALPPGCGGLCVLCAPTSVPSVLSPFLPCGPVASVEKGSAGERSNLNGAWMQSGESSETTEVRDIERENASDTMNHHRSRQPRVVNLHSQHAVLHDNPAPLAIDRLAVGQKNHPVFDCTHFAIRLNGVQAQPVASRGASHGVPEFSNVLRRVIKKRALISQTREAGTGYFMLRIGPSSGTQKDVRVHQTRPESHLVVFLINPFAGKVLGKRRNFIRELCERIEPGANLFRAAQRRGSLAARLAGKNFLDVSLDLDTPRLRLGSDFVGNLDLDFHSKTLARRTRKRRPFGEAKSSAACRLEPQRPNCRLRGGRGMSKNCALHNPKEDSGL